MNSLDTPHISRTLIAPTGIGADVFEALVARFAEVVGPRIVEEIENLLGSEAVYTLSPEYSARKAAGKVKGMVRYPGSAPDQPLILSGQMIEHVNFWIEPPGTLVVGVAPQAGFSEQGFDYAQQMEAISGYLEMALEIVEPEIDALFASVVDEIVDAALDAAFAPEIAAV